MPPDHKCLPSSASSTASAEATCVQHEDGYSACVTHKEGGKHTYWKAVWLLDMSTNCLGARFFVHGAINQTEIKHSQSCHSAPSLWEISLNAPHQKAQAIVGRTGRDAKLLWSIAFLQNRTRRGIYAEVGKHEGNTPSNSHSAHLFLY